MPAPSVVKAEWRGKIYDVPICYEGEKFQRLLERWPPDGIIKLKDIFEEKNSDSSDEEKLTIVKYVFRKSHEPLLIMNVAMAKYYLKNID